MDPFYRVSTDWRDVSVAFWVRAPVIHSLGRCLFVCSEKNENIAYQSNLTLFRLAAALTFAVRLLPTVISQGTPLT